MNKPKVIFSVTALLFVCLFSLTNARAQTPDKQQSESSYEVVLQTIVASNKAIDKPAAVPPTLSNIVKKLRTDYSFSDYRLTSTVLQRVTNKSEFDFKSVSNASGENQENDTPTFINWSLGATESLANEKGRNSIQFQGFRYGQRIPIRSSAGVVNYEQIGLTLKKLNLPENTPTVVGSLATSKPDEMLFLVLTVKSVEE